MIFCNNCGTKIKSFEIKRKFRISRVSCKRWINFYKCNNCNKSYNYRNFIKHKSKMKKILLLIKNYNIKK